MASEKMVKHHARCIDIGRGGELVILTAGLFGRHVTWRAQHSQRAGDGAPCFQQSGQAEIGKVRLALFIQENVSRLYVAMQNAA